MEGQPGPGRAQLGDGNRQRKKQCGGSRAGRHLWSAERDGELHVARDAVDAKAKSYSWNSGEGAEGIAGFK